MLQFLTANELKIFPYLRETMFRDRATQFRDRLSWAVTVDSQGFEQDQYDTLNPLYVIWQNPDGRHGGSMRFLPTSGRCMVNEHFAYLNGGKAIQDSQIWECTRFCLAPGAGQNVAVALMLAGGQLLERRNLRHFVGVFDANMERVYRRIGSSPIILGHHGEGRGRVSLGLWSLTASIRKQVALRACLSPSEVDFWYERSFGAKLNLSV